MGSPVLTVTEVRTYITDIPSANHLLEGSEFSDPLVALAIELAISEFNVATPVSSCTIESFPNKALLLSGTLYKLFSGASALLARNTMNYADGGVQIPVEERAPLYQSLAAMYQSDFANGTRALKNQSNIDSGWGYVSSDEARFPLW